MYIAIIDNLLRQNQITTKTSRMNVLHPLWVLILGSTLFISIVCIQYVRQSIMYVQVFNLG